jgi:hypothetical protein
MADAAIFIGWGNPVRGREQQSLEVFSESMTYWGQLQQEGAIEDVQAYLLEPHGGDLAGFAVLRGDPAKLAELHASEDFQRLVARAGLIVENLGVVRATSGDALTAQMGVYQAQVAELAS